MNHQQIRQQLGEYRRLTGKGQMDRANELMADIVESMLDASQGGGTHAGSPTPEFLAAPGTMGQFGEVLMPNGDPAGGYFNTPMAEQGMDTPVLAGEVTQPDPDSPEAHEAAALALAAAMIKRDKEEQKRLQEGGEGSAPKAEAAPAAEADAADEAGDKKSQTRRKKDA